jgi:hypothetical protein
VISSRAGGQDHDGADYFISTQPNFYFHLTHAYAIMPQRRADRQARLSALTFQPAAT